MQKLNFAPANPESQPQSHYQTAQETVQTPAPTFRSQVDTRAHSRLPKPQNPDSGAGGIKPRLAETSEKSRQSGGHSHSKRRSSRSSFMSAKENQPANLPHRSKFLEAIHARTSPGRSLRMSPAPSLLASKNKSRAEHRSGSKSDRSRSLNGSKQK